MIKKLFILVFVFVFLVSFASAFGITPGRNIINYEPGFEKEYSFSIINSDEENINLVFELSGEFSRFIEFDVNEYSMSASEKSKTFNYKIKLPEEDIFYPGIHEGKIIVRESSSGELVNSVGANMGIAIKIDLDISYPDKYLEVYPQIISEYEEGPVVFLIGAKNKGDMDIENVKSEVNILNEKEKVISSFETTESAIASGEVVELTGEWKKGVKLGNYKSIITTDYDGTEVIVEKQFSVGTIFLEIEKITVRDFKLGEIAILDFLVRNKLNDDVEDCYIKINVYEDGKEIGEIASAPYDLEPLSKKNLVSYWDTDGVSVGEYEGRLILGYREGRFEEDVVVNVFEDNIVIESLGNIRKTKRKLQLDLITLINFVLIIFIFAVSFYLIKKYKKSKLGKKSLKSKSLSKKG